MAEKKEKAAKSRKSSVYKWGEGKLTRSRQHCPKCGAGVFLGQHKDRSSCGRCGYTEFSKKQEA